MIRAIGCEVLKLRRSLVLLVAATPAVMVYLLGVLAMTSGHGAGEWTVLVMSGSAIWAYFLLPMTTIGLAALMAQTEHGPGTWSWSLALPVPRWQIFTAKILVLLGTMALVSASVALAAFAAAWTALLIDPDLVIAGAPDWALAFRLHGQMWIAGICVAAVQWGIAHRFRSFAAPVAIGIGGAFVAVAATSSEYGIFFPWLMPVNMLAANPERAQIALALGGGGGALLFVLLVIWLSRRDWA